MGYTPGTATINGRRYADLAQPLRTVGALLEARAMHTGRSAYNHLLFLAQTQGIPRSRVDQVLGLVGLTEVARKRTGGSRWEWASGSASPWPCWVIRRS